MKVGWGVKPVFQIGLHEKDNAILEQLKTYFGAGSVYQQGSQLFKFCVNSVKDLKVIRKHLDKYPLITKQLAD